MNKSPTIMNLVAELRKDAILRHEAVTPLSPPDKMYMARDLMWRAADEIERLRGVIARNCDASSAKTEGDKTVIWSAKRSV
jgi:hypothetical protein